ncbi:MAG: VWA domain-containing protein [Deltaproteobacteria bacterium]|nr:MAG: VWA domain-containing protein [Deltaproteobacteria bacterium]
MLIDFFFELRRHKVPVTAHEWGDLMRALALGLHDSSVDGFYRLARTLCVKDVAHYDAFDLAFAAYFGGLALDAAAVTEQVLAWLRDPRALDALTPEQRRLVDRLDLAGLRELFERRLREQTERHDGGNRWIGTGGTSPFGDRGAHPTGLRVRDSGAGGRSAMQLAYERRFRDYRRDIVLDVRQIDLALRRLRTLGREGADDELDIDATVDETCRNAGDLELVFRPPKRNRVKLVLLMDVGGSMDPHAHLVERLFTAASRAGRFAQFRHYYFHNCVYDAVYEDASFRREVSVDDLLGHHGRDEKLVVVGDALMHPAELMDPGGALYYFRYNPTSGIDSLRRIEHHFRRAVWLNPEPERYWRRTTIETIAAVFAMFPLTVDGIDRAVRYLIAGGLRPAAAR